MNITNPYDPKQGLMITSSVGSQKYTERLDSFSQVLSDIRTAPFSDNNKFCVDSCWESGNIYYANYDEGYVRKVRYDGVEIAILQLVNPSMVSIIQNSSVMNAVVPYPPQDDQGCWIADYATGIITKTDKDLNIVTQLSGLFNLVCIKADVDGGCYVVRQTGLGGTVLKISSAAQILATMDYTADFLPSITNFIDMAIDVHGNVSLCANDRLYSLVYNSSHTPKLFQTHVIFPLGINNPFPLALEEEHLGAMDIDRNSDEQFLYVAGGNSYESFVLKYDNDILVNAKRYFDIALPYVLKVIQGLRSDSLYILEDSSKWDEYGYGSSSSESVSSSSSSTEIQSSSSSSSLELYCTNPVVTQGGGTELTNWTFYNMSNHNSDSGKLYAFVFTAGFSYIYIYKDASMFNLVAYGQDSPIFTPKWVSLVAQNGSGLSGQVRWNGGSANWTATLDCYESSSSSSTP